jgi:uncharacterized membrane protein YgaE (UPF0421/DUF939 family)
MTGDPFATVSVSLGRIVGVFAGVGIGILFVHVDAASTWRVAGVLFVGAAGSVVLKGGGRPNLEVPIAGLFLIGFATTAAGPLGVQRIWETAVGGTVAIAVSSLLWPPDPVRALRRQLERLRHELAADLTTVAADLATGSGEAAAHLDTVREHSRDAVRDVFELGAARRSLRWSPLRRRDQTTVDLLERRINLAARIFRHTRALARDVADTHVADPDLAAATRHLADAADRALAGGDATDPLARAAASLVADFAGDAFVVAVQLRQLLADLAGGVRDGEAGTVSRNAET